jgi:hypothetical protein
MAEPLPKIVDQIVQLRKSAADKKERAKQIEEEAKHDERIAKALEGELKPDEKKRLAEYTSKEDKSEGGK